MADSRSLLHESLFLAADIGLTYFFYRLYRSKCATADKIKALENVDLSEVKAVLSGSPESSIDYALVDGVVECPQQQLQSHFTEAYGPLRRFKRTALKSERHHGRWVDISSTISDNYDKVPFVLVDCARNSISVQDPLSASFLDEAMVTTHDHFEPNVRSLSENVFDRIVGEISRGVHSTETLLKNGTTMLGVGKLVLSNGLLELRKPEAANTSYILTTMTREELIGKLKSKAFVFKVMAGIFGVAGVIILWLTLGTRLKTWIQNLRSQREMSRVREQLSQLRQASPSSTDSVGQSPADDSSNACVICLTNARELAIRPCGHVCCCIDCYEVLPQPKLCPVCRADITDVLPIFIS